MGREDGKTLLEEVAIKAKSRPNPLAPHTLKAYTIYQAESPAGCSKKG